MEAQIRLPLRFPGQYADAETGWVHHPWRTYLPSQGRFLQPDPLGLVGGWNRYLYAEGDPAGDNAPKMMSIGMHCRLLGRPGRIRALQRFLDHIQHHDHVWVCRRIDLARHWAQRFPVPAI
jgi:RHS repeat-associated protein